MTKFNFRPDDIDLEPVAEESLHFDTIYDQLLYEKSHNRPDYIDPAAAATIISREINEKFTKYYQQNRSADQGFRLEMEKLTRDFTNILSLNNIQLHQRIQKIRGFWND